MQEDSLAVEIAAQLLEAANQAYGDERTRLREEGNQVGVEAMYARHVTRPCIDEAVHAGEVRQRQEQQGLHDAREYTADPIT